VDAGGRDLSAAEGAHIPIVLTSERGSFANESDQRLALLGLATQRNWTTEAFMKPGVHTKKHADFTKFIGVPDGI
jgi:hypothetical protein